MTCSYLFDFPYLLRTTIPCSVFVTVISILIVRSSIRIVSKMAIYAPVGYSSDTPMKLCGSLFCAGNDVEQNVVTCSLTSRIQSFVHEKQTYLYIHKAIVKPNFFHTSSNISYP